MYLHLGADCMVKNSDIIAIFDMRSEESTIAEEYIKPYKDRYKIVDASYGEEYSSCILTEDTLYLSSISSLTSSCNFKTLINMRKCISIISQTEFDLDKKTDN